MLRFAVSYDIASHVYTLSHRGEMSATTSGRRVTFAYESAEARKRYAINVNYADLLAPGAEESRTEEALAAEQRLQSMVASCVALRNGIKHFTPSADLWVLALESARLQSQPGSINDELSCGTYTVSSFRRVVLCLSAISRVGLILARLLPVGEMAHEEETFWVPLILTASTTLESRLRELARVPTCDVGVILSDLTFNERAGRDIEVSPLLRVGNEYFLAPHLIAPYRWRTT